MRTKEVIIEEIKTKQDISTNIKLAYLEVLIDIRDGIDNLNK